MKSLHTRRFRRRSPAREAASFKKDNQPEQQFFGEPTHEPFFKPATALQQVASVQRKCADCEKEDKVQRAPEKKEEEKKVQRATDKKEEEKVMKKEGKKEEEKVQKKETSTSSATSSATASNYISAINSKGQSMDAGVKSFYENRMGSDFSDVKIHTGKEAAESAKDINAQAYAYGNNIVFNEGKYQPETSEGKHLLAHELAHVVQQKNETVQRKVNRKALTEICSGYDFVIYQDTINSIDFRVGLSKAKSKDEVKKYKKKIEANNDSMAGRINSDNQLIKNPGEHVKECFILDTSTRLAIKDKKNILLMHPKNADEQTTAHEMGHALFDFMRNNTDTKLMDPARAAKFQNKLAELFTRLGNETITIKRGVTMSATDIVDPSIWGGLAPEHPGKDVDEFFASAKSAFQTDKKRLITAIQKFGKDNSNILFAGAELIHLLDSFFSGGELPDANEKIQDEKNAANQVAGISPATDYAGSLATSALLQNLISKTC